MLASFGHGGHLYGKGEGEMSAYTETYDTWKKYTPLTDEQKQMILDNSGLIYNILNGMPTKLRATRNKYKDLVQEGYIALARAAQLYIPNSKTKFSTYAHTSIERTLYRWAVRFSKSYIVPRRTKAGDLQFLPSEVSKDSWGDKIIGSYHDPVICIWESYSDEEFDNLQKEEAHNRSIKWDYESCLSEAGKFITKTDWQKNGKESYYAARKNRWLRKIYGELNY